MRVTLSHTRFYSLVALLTLSLLASFAFSSVAQAAPANSAAHKPGFSFHMLSRQISVSPADGGSLVPSPTSSSAPNSVPPPPPVECLTVTMTMQNPQVDVLVIKGSVKNSSCGRTVTVAWFEYTTQIVCNDESGSGPYDGYGGSSLNPGQTLNYSINESAICYNEYGLPGPYNIRGFADGSAVYSGQQLAVGEYTTPWYYNFV